MLGGHRPSCVSLIFISLLTVFAATDILTPIPPRRANMAAKPEPIAHFLFDAGDSALFLSPQGALNEQVVNQFDSIE